MIKKHFLKPTKRLILFILIGFTGIFIMACQHGNNIQKKTDDQTLEFYKHYGYYTDPGEYVQLYQNLTTNLAELCKIIKAQLIHPIADLPLYPELVQAGRTEQDSEFSTVKLILAGLIASNPAGLTLERKPEERLIVSCRYHAILLASILKYQGIPSRVRYGFASYLYPDYRIYHVICEVWNVNEKRWMLVDPDRQKVDFPRTEFELSQDVWLNYINNNLNPSVYGFPGWMGDPVILSALCHDLASVLSQEHLYLEQPVLYTGDTMDVKNLAKEQINLLNNIAFLLKDPDRHFQELQEELGSRYLQFKK